MTTSPSYPPRTVVPEFPPKIATTEGKPEQVTKENISQEILNVKLPLGYVTEDPTPSTKTPSYPPKPIVPELQSSTTTTKGKPKCYERNKLKEKLAFNFLYIIGLKILLL